VDVRGAFLGSVRPPEGDPVLGIDGGEEDHAVEIDQFAGERP
jgi:hypothetical protein